MAKAVGNGLMRATGAAAEDPVDGFDFRGEACEESKIQRVIQSKRGHMTVLRGNIDVVAALHVLKGMDAFLLEHVDV